MCKSAQVFNKNYPFEDEPEEDPLAVHRRTIMEDRFQKRHKWILN